jgi:hypothetical protein
MDTANAFAAGFLFGWIVLLAGLAVVEVMRIVRKR